jgi:hypothetical protein
VAKLSIYKYVRTDKGWRYCKAAFHPNGKIKPNVVFVSGVEEKHTEGRYFLNLNNRWIDVGEDALEAQRKRLLRLNRIEFERLSGTILPASPVGRPTVVEFSGRRVIKDEVDAYLADLELSRDPLGLYSPSVSTSAISLDSSKKRSQTNTAARMFSSTKTNCRTKASSRKPSTRG